MFAKYVNAICDFKLIKVHFFSSAHPSKSAGLNAEARANRRNALRAVLIMIKEISHYTYIKNLNDLNPLLQ